MNHHKIKKKLTYSRYDAERDSMNLCGQETKYRIYVNFRSRQITVMRSTNQSDGENKTGKLSFQDILLT